MILLKVRLDLVEPIKGELPELLRQSCEFAHTMSVRQIMLLVLRHIILQVILKRDRSVRMNRIKSAIAMAELTTEYLDTKLDTLTTSFDKKLEAQTTSFDKKLAELPTTAEIVRMLLPLHEADAEIKSSMATRDDVKELRSEMNTKFDAILELLDVRKKVDQLENDMRTVKHELKLA
jgi:lipoate synthase